MANLNYSSSIFIKREMNEFGESSDPTESMVDSIT